MRSRRAHVLTCIILISLLLLGGLLYTYPILIAVGIALYVVAQTSAYIYIAVRGRGL